MAKAAPAQSNFNGGEFSPLVQGRVDAAEKYKTGLATCLNYLPTIQGPLIRRPGTEYIAATQFNATPSRLQPFKYSTTDSYVLEFGQEYMAFYKDDGQIQVSSTAYLVTTPYQAADVFLLNFVQTANVIYILHPLYPPAKLTRISDSSWTYSVVNFLDGPYLPLNTTATTMAMSSGGGTLTMTASSIVGINGGQGFLATDVGSFIRYRASTSSVTWFKITVVTSTTTCTVVLQGPSVAPGTAVGWQMSLWSQTNGYPACGVFYQDRLALAGGNTVYPERIDLSNSGDYENFAPTDATITAVDSNAISMNLRSNDVNSVYWMTCDEHGLLAGTSAGEWVINSSTGVLAAVTVAPTVVQVTQYGSSQVQAVQVGKSTMFVQNGGKKLREMNYNFYVSGFRSPDRTVIAEHISGASGFKQMAYQKSPHSFLWAVRNDGILAAMTYEHDEEQDSLIIGWSRHQLGLYTATSLVAQGAFVESIAVIPSPDGTYEQVWMIVNRTGTNPFVDGGNNRSVEVLTAFFAETDDPREAWFLDAALSYNNPLTITSLTINVGPGTVTVGVTAHGYSNGDTVLFEDLGINNDSEAGLNNNRYVIENVTTNTFDVIASPGGFTGTGVVRKCVSKVGGLTYLLGNTVSILADGAKIPPQIVANDGTITITPVQAARIVVGLPYNSDGQMLRLEAGSQTGAALGKKRRTNRVGFDLYQVNGFYFGMSFDALDIMPVRTINDDMGVAVPLFSGIVSEALDADYDYENQICWRQSDPFPGTIRAVLPQMETQDRT